jgi:hypothetical protein
MSRLATEMSKNLASNLVSTVKWGKAKKYYAQQMLMAKRYKSHPTTLFSLHFFCFGKRMDIPTEEELSAIYSNC